MKQIFNSLPWLECIQIHHEYPPPPVELQQLQPYLPDDPLHGKPIPNFIYMFYFSETRKWKLRRQHIYITMWPVIVHRPKWFTVSSTNRLQSSTLDTSAPMMVTSGEPRERALSATATRLSFLMSTRDRIAPRLAYS